MLQMIFAAVTSVILAVVAPAVLLDAHNVNDRAALIMIVQDEANDADLLVTLKSQDGIKKMNCEEYVAGVVLSEMPASFHMEALKAQAVAARTFTMYRMEHPKHGESAVCDDSGCCQAWNDPNYAVDKLGDSASEMIEKVRQAVKQTEGEYLTYRGELIEAPFFSCSGGKTEAAVAVWGSDVPYLQSVESQGEEHASKFKSEKSFSSDEFKNIMRGYDSEISFDVTAETWIGSVTCTDGGGVDVIEICGRKYRGTEVRKLFGLDSTAFTVEFTNNIFVFSTRGFGHRVGMSQYGAEAMASTGADYVEILKHYYQGVEINNK